MRQITILGGENNQKISSISDGIEFTMYLRFISIQESWFMDIVCPSKTINNIRIFNSGNMLHQFKNLLNFGLMCTVSDGREPSFVNDFSSSRCKLYILNKAEVDNYSKVVSGEISA
jgi:hypothetical protein